MPQESMRSLTAIIVVLLFLVAGLHAQQSMTQAMAGPSGDKYRILVAFMGTAGDDSYKLQSFILDLNRVKKNEQPNSFYLDLTVTDRVLSTGAKKQKILVQRWGRSSEVEVKCEGGKWMKQSLGQELDDIRATVDMLVKNVPMDAKEPTEFALTEETRKSIERILTSLNTSKLQCIRGGSE